MELSVADGKIRFVKWIVRVQVPKSPRTCRGSDWERFIDRPGMFRVEEARGGVLANKPRYGINVFNDDCNRNCLIGNDLYDSGSTCDLNDVPTTNPTLKHDNRDLAGTEWLLEV